MYQTENLIVFDTANISIYSCLEYIIIYYIVLWHIGSILPEQMVKTVDLTYSFTNLTIGGVEHIIETR